MSAVLSPPAAPVAPASSWRLALPALVVVLGLLGWLYFDTVASMVAIWNRSETFAHAFLVPPISAWLIWRQRHVLATLTPQPAWWLLLPLAAFAGMWLLADLVLVNSASQFAWVAMLVLAVPAVLGLRVAYAIMFPLLFLFFAVPIGEFMTDPMMDWTADFTVAALRASGIPVYREGLNFVIPSGNWSVVEACSGVRYLIASFMVGTLFAYLNFTSWQRRATFMVVSILVPIIANWVRAYGIVMLGHHSGNTIAVGVDHLIYGWVFFGVVVTIMFVIGARWADAPAPAAKPDLQAAVASGSSGSSGRSGSAAIRPAVIASAAGAVIAVLALPHAALWALERAEQDATAPVLTLPALPGWSGTPLAIERAAAVPGAVVDATDFLPVFENPSLAQRRLYAGSDGEVGLYVAYYRGQRDDRKLVSSVNALVRSDDWVWNAVRSGSASAAAGPATVPVRTAEILGAESSRSRRAQLTVWRVYWIDGRWVASDIRAKAHGAFARLMGRGDEGAAVVLWTDDDDRARAQARLQAFTRDALPALDGALAATRAQR